MTIRTGSQTGIDRRATILKYANGIVSVRIDEVGIAQDKLELQVPIPASWVNRYGEIFAKYPSVGDSVLIRQIQGGAWIISSYYPSDGSFSGTLFSSDMMDDFKPGRILAQVKNKIKLFLDPQIGIKIGDSNHSIHIDPLNNIYSNNFPSNYSFSNASRQINGVVKRDLADNSSRALVDSTLESHTYDKSLVSIGLDPTAKVSLSTSGLQTRNPSFVESREVVYEFANDFGFETDDKEFEKYSSKKNSYLNDNKFEMRPNVFGLSLEYPNHLIEEIKGTGVDSFGNVLDINRSILPIGKTDNLSLSQSTDKPKTFLAIREEERKSLAYHFEINSRKTKVPDISLKDDYQRDNSRTFFDIDKEGTFKINIAASSEVGNVHLLTRYTNYSNLLSKQNPDIDPKSFVRSESGQDIFLSSFSTTGGIKLSGEKSLDGYQSPTDRFTEKPIQLNTAYHDITKTCNEFLETANWIKAGMKLVDFHPTNRLNLVVKPIKQIVSPEIKVNGENANAGGRSGMINLDGFIALNIGANTIDRQSLWFDCAGGIVSNVGRDRNGISYAGNYDGDVLIQVGGNGIDSSLDSRFENESATYRNGTVEIRLVANGQLYIFRMASEGISLVSPGRVDITANQGISLKTNGILALDAEEIMCYPSSSKRLINRMPPTTIG